MRIKRRLLPFILLSLCSGGGFAQVVGNSGPAKPAGEQPAKGALHVTSTPPDAAFEILNADNIQVKSGRTPATVREPPAGPSRIIYRRANLPPLRFSLEPGATEVAADFTILVQWLDLQMESQAAAKRMAETRQLAEVIGPSVLKEIGKLALDHQNEQLIALLRNHGITVQAAKTDADPKSALASPATPAPSMPDPVAARPTVAPPSALIPLPAFDPVDWNADAIKEWETTVARLRTEVEDTRKLLRQAKAFQKEYEKILGELLDLPQTDDDAKTIVQRWRIQRNPAQ